MKRNLNASNAIYSAGKVMSFPRLKQVSYAYYSTTMALNKISLVSLKPLAMAVKTLCPRHGLGLGDGLFLIK